MGMENRKMEKILVKPTQLRSNAQTLRSKAKTIKASLEQVEKVVRVLDDMKFSGIRASSIRTRFFKQHVQLISASSFIYTFAKDLEESASIFERADKGEQRITRGDGAPIDDRVNTDNNVVKRTTEDYPIPPIKHKLNKVNASDYGNMGCARYAAARRPDLGSTQSNQEEFTDQAAANYISKYKATAFQVKPDVNLTNVIGEGYAVVWKPGVQGANSTYGHVAIVEEIGSDYVVVSHAGWSSGTKTKIPIDKLQELWLIP
jgi:surface antigen